MIYLTFRLLSFIYNKHPRDPAQFRNRVGRIRIIRLLAWEGRLQEIFLATVRSGKL